MTELLSLSMQIVSSISVISSVSVVIFYHRFSHLQKKSYFTLQYYVAVSSALTSVGSAIGVVEDGTFECWFQGFSTNIFTLSSIQWTTIMVMSLYSIVHYEKQIEVTPLIHVYCWLPPILATVLPLINSTYGNVGNWCWVIDTNKTPVWGTMFWFWVSFYGWVWLGFFLMVFLLAEIRYFSAKKESKSTIRSKGASTLKKIISTLNLYPLVILISWGPACVSDTMAQMLDVYYITFGGIGSICACSQGILTALIFWFRNDEVRKLAPQFFNKYAQISDSTVAGKSSRNESLKSVSEQVSACVSAVSKVKGNKSRVSTSSTGPNPFETKSNGPSLNQITNGEGMNDIELGKDNISTSITHNSSTKNENNYVREFQSSILITGTDNQYPSIS